MNGWIGRMPGAPWWWGVLLTALGLAACNGDASVVPLPAPQALPQAAAFMGDSITQGWDLPQYDPGPTINFGISGQDTSQMRDRFTNEVLASAPSVVVILGGVNDFFHFGVSGTSIEFIQQMAAEAKSAGIQVILCSVLPADTTTVPQDFTLADVQTFNRQLAQLAQANGYLYADYYDAFVTDTGQPNNTLLYDGLHPNEAGYAVMWKVLAPLLKQDGL